MVPHSLNVMGLRDDFFERFGRRRRKLTPEQITLLREMLVKAYNLVYYILGDTKDTKALAQRALAGVMDDFDVLKHRSANQTSYRRSIKDPSVRRVPLPMDLELAVRVFALTSAYQWRTRYRASIEDLDVWFCKCVLLESLRHGNAFSVLYGLTNGIHAYSEKDFTLLFDTLTLAVPRNKEGWNEGNEPLLRYRKNLAHALNNEFGSVIKRDPKGNLIRRPLNEQPVKLIAEYVGNLVKLKSGDTCLGNMKTPYHSRDSDGESELTRLHIVLHWPCYTGLTAAAELKHPKDKAGMPEYATMIKSNGNRSRQAPALGDEELDTMVNQFQLMIASRRHASFDIIVTVDGSELRPASSQLTETGKTQFQLNESAKLIEIWARGKDGPDVLLKAFFLSLGAEHQTITLAAGQEISFTADYLEAADTEGRFELSIGYRETKLRRRIQQQISSYKLPNLPIPLTPPAVLAGGLSIIAAAAALLSLFQWLGAFSPISALWSRQSHTIAKQEPHAPGHQKVAPAEGRDSGSVPSGEALPEPTATQSVLVSGTPGATPRKRGSLQGRHTRTPAGVANTVLRNVPSLASIDRIYLENSGVYDNSDVNRRLYSLQMDALKKSQMFHLKDDPDEAQARLVMVSDFESGTGDKAQAQLITAKEGIVIWYGPLVSVARDSDPKVAADEVRNLVQVITHALVNKKEETLNAEKAAPNR